MLLEREAALEEAAELGAVAEHLEDLEQLLAELVRLGSFFTS